MNIENANKIQEELILNLIKVFDSFIKKNNYPDIDEIAIILGTLVRLNIFMITTMREELLTQNSYLEIKQKFLDLLIRDLP